MNLQLVRLLMQYLTSPDESTLDAASSTRNDKQVPLDSTPDRSDLSSSTGTGEPNTVEKGVEKKGALASDFHYNSTNYLERYVKFLFTPEAHGDSYIEGFHRQFLVNHVRSLF